MWRVGAQAYAVIEAKSGAVTDFISKKDANQLGGSSRWYQETYGQEATVHPIAMHASETVERTGTPPSGMRVLTPPKLDELKSAVRAFAAIATGEEFRKEEVVARLLAHHKLTQGDVLQVYTVAAKQQR